MSALAQELAAYAAVAFAGVWLAIRWRRRRSARACSQCGPTPAPRGRTHLPVVDG